MVTSQRVRTDDGIAIAFVDEGPRAAPVVVMSHSIGCDRSMWDAQAEALVGRRRVVRFDRRGHGESGVPAGPADIERLARDALAVLDAIGVETADFVGNSQGAMEGMWLAVERPSRIRRLVAANTTAWLGLPARMQAAIDAALGPQGPAALAGLAVGFLERWVEEDFRRDRPAAWDRLVRGFAGMSPSGFAACAAALRDVDLRPVLGRIRVPTLVVVGGAEAEPLQAAARALVDGIPGARLASVPGSGHLTPIDRPAEFNALLVEFLG